MRREQGDQSCSVVARTGLGHCYKSRRILKSVYKYATLRRIYDTATICRSCWPVDSGENYFLSFPRCFLFAGGSGRRETHELRLWGRLCFWPSYDFFVIGQVFVFGCSDGARWKCGSTLPKMLLHGLLNAGGMLETYMALRA